MSFGWPLAQRRVWRKIVWPLRRAPAAVPGDRKRSPQAHMSVPRRSPGAVGAGGDFLRALHYLPGLSSTIESEFNFVRTNALQRMSAMLGSTNIMI